MNAANGVLANDAPNGGTATFSAASTQGGTVAGNADGSFTYTPANSFVGTDSFTYSVTNAAGSVTCTVTITVNAVNGFFVDAVNGSDTNGSFQGGVPFQTIQAAVAAAPTNADIVVTSGNYTGGINLKDGQRLLGSGSVLAQGATRPQLTGPVVLADGNTLDFLRIEGTNGNAVDADGQNGGTVTNCEFANTMAGGGSGTGILGDGTSGTWTVSNNDFQSLAGSGIGFFIVGTDTATIIITNNTATGNGLAGAVLGSEGTSDVRASVAGNVFRGNNMVTGDAFELECADDSTFCLNLENNVADLDTNAGNGDNGVFSLLDSPFGTAVLSVEQFAGGNLTNPQPGGAGNSGIIEDNTGIGGDLPTSVADGDCGF